MSIGLFILLLVMLYLLDEGGCGCLLILLVLFGVIVLH